jgi:hypothetical protein
MGQGCQPQMRQDVNRLPTGYGRSPAVVLRDLLAYFCAKRVRRDSRVYVVRSTRMALTLRIGGSELNGAGGLGLDF